MGGGPPPRYMQPCCRHRRGSTRSTTTAKGERRRRRKRKRLTRLQTCKSDFASTSNKLNVAGVEAVKLKDDGAAAGAGAAEKSEGVGVVLDQEKVGWAEKRLVLVVAGVAVGAPKLKSDAGAPEAMIRDHKMSLVCHCCFAFG